jgi:predicted GNAT family acetyltransferase
LGQLGGVYTLPAFRKKGFAKSLISHLMGELQSLDKVHHLIIFTGEGNKAAKRLYESLGAHFVGHYALLFGSANEK